MIDTFIKLLEKLTEFAKLKSEATEKSYQMLIKPIYEDMEVIHKNYLQMFETCRNNLFINQKVEYMANQLASLRLKEEALRRSVAAFMDVYLFDPSLRKYYNFFWSVKKYLKEPTLAHYTEDTESLKVLREFERFMLKKKTRANVSVYKHKLIIMCDGSLRRIRLDWKRVSMEFAKIKKEAATK